MSLEKYYYIADVMYKKYEIREISDFDNGRTLMQSPRGFFFYIGGVFYFGNANGIRPQRASGGMYHNTTACQLF